MTIHAFTSVTRNYIPKARVLARTFKRHHPDWSFHLVLSDTRPDWLGDSDSEPFDSVICADELGIPDFRSWTFRHSVVELCTGVKGFSFLEIARRHNPEKIFYLDPDIAVVGSLSELSNQLDRGAVLLTPHVTLPETTPRGVTENEICTLQHGVYNLGFLGVRMAGQGLDFVRWWAERLHQHCYDDIPRGLFTDQRWADLAPCLFDGVDILRSPRYNVATWNLSRRQVTGTAPDQLEVNGQSLSFYHFSGLDSGNCEAMLDRYGSASPVLRNFLVWYLDRCNAAGQREHGKTPCVYDFYDDGQRISKEERRIYREDEALVQRFPDPYAAGPHSYHEWLQSHGASVAMPESVEDLQHALCAARNELNSIKRSRSWRLARGLAGLANRSRRLWLRK